MNITNLEEYVALAVDATIRSGIYRQVEAFKSGFNEVRYFVMQNLSCVIFNCVFKLGSFRVKSNSCMLHVPFIFALGYILLLSRMQ